MQSTITNRIEFLQESWIVFRVFRAWVGQDCRGSRLQPPAAAAAKIAAAAASRGSRQGATIDSGREVEQAQAERLEQDTQEEASHSEAAHFHR